ncbi:MAG: phenylalanine--tRNA ligase subunit beta [Acidimicrobiales bacterium]
MRASLSWLRELTPLSADAGDRASVVELASELDALGLVVEETEWVGQGLGDVVLARVLEIAGIEGADRIRRVVVDRGAGETAEVVCGAWNFEVGDVVVLAPVGAVLPGDFKIERRKMKGVVSNGMLCSGRELRLSEEHEGILVLARPEHSGLPAGIELGVTIAEHLGFGPDVVFDLAIEPNRPDCLSMVGIARDLASRFGLPLLLPEPSLVESGPPANELATVEIAEPELCQRFVARVMTGVTPIASPAVIQRRLLMAGMRPIGHMVDASNYVMLELGQPTHPYDLDQVGGHGLRVRAARPGESLVTLDGETRVLGDRPARDGDALTALDALICDANDVPVGIAGVMGGQSSEIGEATDRVLLEVARFTPVSVGRTARYAGLRSEASIRFERGVDALGQERAAARVCELAVDAAVQAGVAPPVVATGLVDANPRPFERSRIRLRPFRANALLGVSLEDAEMTALLAPIGYEIGSVASGTAGMPGTDGAIELVVPSWRPDVVGEVDVIEDIARTYGYRRIPRTDRRSPYVGSLDAVQVLRRRVRRVLAGLGAHEAWTSSIVDPGEQALAGVDAALIRLANPMVAEESVLRGALLPGLLKSLRHNASHRNPWIRLFEMGDVFGLAGLPGSEDASLPHEHERIAVMLAWEDDDAGAAVNAWRVVADALGIIRVEILQPSLGGAGADVGEVGGGGEVRAMDLSPSELAIGLSGLHLARSGLLVCGAGDGGTIVGAVGEVDPAVLLAFGIPHARVGWLELNVAHLASAPRRPDEAQPVSRFPSSDIDLAFAVDESVAAARVEAALRAVAGELCESVELFDVYRGAGVEEGQRSLAYRLRLCSLDRTLTDVEVAEVRQRCIDAVQSALPAALRS